MKYNLQLKSVYLDAVESQLRNNNPPETRETLERLREEGLSEDDAKLLIASAIAAESYFILKSRTEFNLERFVRNLKRLPDQSFDSE
ncbi:MAG: hypothetical protein ABSB78_09545 [Bacteroidota bacterium]